MTIIITAAGSSRRFKEAGVLRPKWSLEIEGRSMIARAIDSLSTFFDDGHELRIVITADQIEELGGIKHELPPFTEIVVERPTPPGQAIDAFSALNGIDPLSPLVIFNSDTLIHTKNLSGLVQSFSCGEAWLVLAPKPDNEWSFAEIHNDYVIRCAEKERISPFASSGLYGFRSVAQYKKIVLSNLPFNGNEMYIAPLYNDLIANGEIVKAIVVHSDDVESVGTPAQLFAACARHNWSLPGELL
jgi:dTDP-glucose pyrophosphorylase